MEIDLTEPNESYSKVLCETEFNRLCLSVNTFRGLEYLSIREQYLDFEGEWAPGSKGFSTPLDVMTVQNLFKGVAEIISLAESREVIESLFGDIIKDIYTQ